MKCPKCNTKMEKRYLQPEDHPDYGKDLPDDDRFILDKNNSWKNYKGRNGRMPYYCPNCEVIKFIMKA